MSRLKPAFAEHIGEHNSRNNRPTCGRNLAQSMVTEEYLDDCRRKSWTNFWQEDL